MDPSMIALDDWQSSIDPFQQLTSCLPYALRSNPSFDSWTDDYHSISFDSKLVEGTHSRSTADSAGCVVPVQTILEPQKEKPRTRASSGTPCIRKNASQMKDTTADVVKTTTKPTKRKVMVNHVSKSSSSASRVRQIGQHLGPRGKQPSTENGDEQLALTESMQQFQISDEDKVKKYLMEQFQLLQQQSCKKIAKAWIKAICPKKQAKFPYRRTRRDEDGQEHKEPEKAPGWWPQSCSHTEPDHITREERLNLLVDILRLRLTPEQLMEKNGALGESVRSHHFVSWTQFLKEQTPISLFDELYHEPKDKIARRPDVLKDIFEKAMMEEEYYLGGSDANVTIAWTPRPDIWKQIRTPTTRPKRRLSSSVDEQQAAQAESNAKATAKRAKTGTQKPKSKERKSTATAVDKPSPASTGSGESSADNLSLQNSRATISKPFRYYEQDSSTPVSTSVNTSFSSQPMTKEMPVRCLDQDLSTSMSGSANTSFSSQTDTKDYIFTPDVQSPAERQFYYTCPDPCQPTDTYATWYTAINGPRFPYEPFHLQQQPVMVHSVLDHSQPHFEATPSTQMAHAGVLKLDAQPFGYYQDPPTAADGYFSPSSYGNFRPWGTWPLQWTPMDERKSTLNGEQASLIQPIIKEPRTFQPRAAINKGKQGQRRCKRRQEQRVGSPHISGAQDLSSLPAADAHQPDSIPPHGLPWFQDHPIIQCGTDQGVRYWKTNDVAIYDNGNGT